MNDLLKVLDMSEDEQITWFYRRHEKELHDIVWIAPVAKFKDYRLADLAFRLRDEVINYKGWGPALCKVWVYWQDPNNIGITLEGFWIHRAKPIHFIIAALIAKEKEDV